MGDTFASIRAFAGGEVTPEFFGRIDDGKYQTGLALCRNFTVLPHGPAKNRPGTRYVNTSKLSTHKVRIIPFYYSDDQTLIIEIGAGYFRFHTQGGTILNGGGTPLEVSNFFAESELFDLHYVQSADVITFVHPNHSPTELRRLSATSWTSSDIVFGPKYSAPTGLSVTPYIPGTHGTPTDQNYLVTSADSTGIDESGVPLYVTTSNNLYDDGAHNTLNWSAPTTGPTPGRYIVYKDSAGQFAYIGSVGGTSFSFIDDNIAPDLGRVAPDARNPFYNNFPSETTYFDQRRVFAATVNTPQQVWMSKTGTDTNFDQSLPTQDTDAIIFRAAARDGNSIRHLVPMTELIMLTSSTVWRVTSLNSDALTPSSVGVRVQAASGASKVKPIVADTSCVYIASRGGHMRQLGYASSYGYGTYQTIDMCLRAPHLFDGFDIVDLAYQQSPYPYIWAVSSNGSLIGCTFIPSEQVGAFHHHDTLGGTFESVAVVAEGVEDAVYVVVNRGGVRYIERFASRADTNGLTNAYFVDCGATYNGAPSATISGLTWLVGQTVNILADGAVSAPQVVSPAGSITLDYPASVVHVGLPITAQLQTLPLAFQIPGYGSGRPKTVGNVTLLVNQSGGIGVGVNDFDAIHPAELRTTEDLGSPPALYSGEVDILADDSWSPTGQVVVQQTDPLPLTVLAMTIDVSVGG